MNLNKFHFLLLAGFTMLLLQACSSRPPASADEEPEHISFQAIDSVLDAQVEAWNNGDIHAFMDGYWKSDSLRFASGGTVRRGWQETLDRYLASYPDRATMGQLAFEDLEMKRFSPQWATVFGRFRLKREAPLSGLTGLFTLHFEKRNGAWIIVSDHTSAG